MKKLKLLHCKRYFLTLFLLCLFTLTTWPSQLAHAASGSLCTGSNELSNVETGVFSQNNLSYWNPCECINKGGGGGTISSGTCFKINSGVDPSDAWYAEGCLNNGTCTGGVYASTAYTNGTGADNDSLISDTKTDDDLGGMQYIYAENYDIEFDGIDGWIPKFTKKSDASSTQKYYWIVLPSEAYSNGFGETYVAAFENLSDPIYFITYDTHACEHQSEDYCGQARANPDEVEIGKEFFGAITKDAGSPTAAANKLGKLKSLCRINGRGEVLVTSSGDASTVTATSGGSTDSGTSTPSTDTSAGATSETTAGKTVAEKIYNWFVKANISGVSDSPEVIAGIIGSFATESGGNTIEGLNPFSWSSWGGTLLGCIPMYCGDIKSKVTEAVGHDYFAYKTGVDGIPEDAVDKAIDLELKFMINDYNSGNNWKTFTESLDAVSNKTPESYAELFAVIVENAAGDVAVEDEGILNWISSHSGYSASQQVLDKRRTLAREAYEKLGGGGCGGKNPVVEVDGNEYMFPLAGAAKDNYLNPDGSNGESVLSSMPCTNSGGCHHDYQALDMGLRKSKVDGSEYTSADFPDTHYDDLYYYSTGVKALAFVGGEITSYGCYSNRVPDGYDTACKCASIGYHGDDGLDYWIGHLSYDSNIKVGDKFELGDVMGEVGPPPCAQGTQAHIHINIEPYSSKINDIMNAAFNALPETSGGTASGGSCGATSGIPTCDGGSGSGSGSGGGTISTGGLDQAAAEALAKYYNDGGGTQCGGASRQSCYAFSMWWLCNFTSIVREGENACSGVATGEEVVGCLADRYGVSTGTEPKPYAVFSGPTHTGVVVGVQDDGTILTIEAAEYDGVSYFGWGDGDGKARVWKNSSYGSTAGLTFAYVGDKVDTSKLSGVVGK